MSIPAAPTQVVHPWRAVLRTFIAAGVGVAVAWIARTLGIDLTTFTPALVDSITAAAWALGTGVVQWLLTRPRVEAWLRRFLPPLAADPVVIEVQARDVPRSDAGNPTTFGDPGA